MQLEFFSTWTQGKGNCPLPLQPIPKNNTNINPKNNTNINNKTEAVYTEGLTHPRRMEILSSSLIRRAYWTPQLRASLLSTSWI